jgi:EAL domain-containing protein (putative c-di-GMP-specific phosphodiesterase class I)
MIRSIGSWVLRAALEQGLAWTAEHPDQPFVMGVNIAARQLNDPAFTKDAIEMIHEVGFDPVRLVFEITESAVLTDPGTVEATLQSIRGLGVHLALDDFGTGYSSLVHLKRFPIETVKLDQSFVHGLKRDPDDDAIVAALSRLAHDLGILVVAEGVETQEQVDELVRHGCPFGQGHFWSPAVPADQLEWNWPSLR